LNKQISIIGCGWFGLPLAKYLKKEGFNIKGSTTSYDKLAVLSSEGIEPFLIRLSPQGIIGDITNFLKNSDTVVINVPPGFKKDPKKDFVAEMKHLLKTVELSTIKNVLLVSSTSVYEDTTAIPEISCDTLPNAQSKSAQQLIAVESLFINSERFKTTVLRFAGLIGDNRHPCYHLSGKIDVANPNAPVNLIHLNDCVNISILIIKDGVFGLTFNAAFTKHPSRLEYYTNKCKAINLEPPTFSFSEKSKGKIINSLFLVRKLNYTFTKHI
jgi:nucleoside-diphosphate-sugar epimerase